MNDAIELLEARCYQAVVVAGWPCIQCGYDLRGQPTWAQCPECGTAVFKSLKGPYLFQSSDDWLRRVRNGLRLIVVVGGFQTLVRLMYVAINLDLVSSRGLAWAFSYQTKIASMLLEVVATWYLTSPPIDRDFAHHAPVARRLRICVVIESIAFYNLLPALERPFPLRSTAVMVIGLILFGMVIEVLYYSYAAALAAELPDAKLRNRLLSFRWASVLAVAVSHLFEWTLIAIGLLFASTHFYMIFPGFIASIVVGAFALTTLWQLSNQIDHVVRRHQHFRSSTASVSLTAPAPRPATPPDAVQNRVP